MGLAKRKGAVEEVLQILLKEGVGIIQLPCPETSYFGLRRFWAVREQLNNPGFNEYCKRLSQKIRNIVSEYLRNDYDVIGVIGIKGSPSCGVTESGSSEDWIGPPNKAGEYVRVKKPGIFMEKLTESLKALPFIEWDWRNTESSISKVKELINRSKAEK